jgi:FkbH-like protein
MVPMGVGVSGANGAASGESGRRDAARADTVGQFPAEPGLSAGVKLVVWDLDETLWAGTLSEGAVTIEPSRIDLVRTLNRRGIVNSISSKNEHDDVRRQLEQAGLWSEFVFPRIEWSPKGPGVAQIIDDAQLRPENVLFIDDLAINRAEVRHFSPGIQTAGPEIIDHLLSLDQLSGKDDRSLTRLRQYQLLERKIAARREATSSNEDFLRSCDIRVGIYHDADLEVDRLFELVNRTNQLNFTKRRPDRAEFESMLGDPRYDTGYVAVSDRYGAYGICGFYAVSVDDRTLVDFSFSCRVLHMGVEQWVYGQLGRPAVSVVGEVASRLEGAVDWITEDHAVLGDARVDPEEGSGGADRPPPQPNRILMVGGCDLSATAGYLGGDIATDFSYVGPTGTFVHVGHTELLRKSVSGLTAEQRAVVDRLPFLDPPVFRSPVVVASRYDVLVYSVLTDYTQGLYRHRETGLVVPWHQCDYDVTNPAFRSALTARFTREGMDREFFDRFAREFEFLGGITADQFEENIRWLAIAVPTGARIIFLNGSEVPMDNPREPGRHLRHRAMNEALDRAIEGLPLASVCDVRSFVFSEDDVTDNIRHYRRRTYLRMAEEIRAVDPTQFRVQPTTITARAYGGFRKFASRRRMQLTRRWKRLHRVPSGHSG